MAGALYMGPSSAFGGVFGKPPIKPPQPPIPIGPQFDGGGKNPNDPLPTGPPGSVLGAQAIRASGPSKGFDASYLQNLATAIGGLFSGNKTGNTTSFNPLGDLSEISGPSGMEGNAPSPGLPLTWLQQALNGLGFSFTSPTPMPAGPANPAGGDDGGDGNNRRGRGGRTFNLQ